MTCAGGPGGHVSAAVMISLGVCLEGGQKELRPGFLLSFWSRLGLYHRPSSLLSRCYFWTMVVARFPCPSHA